MFRRALLSTFLWAAMACAIASPGLAQEPYPRGAYGSDVLPLDRVLPTVRNGRPGQFYDAEGPFPDAYGGYHYRIKWLTPEGRVVWLDADARSGRVLGVARGDWREQGPPAFGGSRFAPGGARPYEPYGAEPRAGYGAPPRGPGGYGPPPRGPGGFGAPRGGPGGFGHGPGGPGRGFGMGGRGSGHGRGH